VGSLRNASRLSGFGAGAAPRPHILLMLEYGAKLVKAQPGPIEREFQRWK
jgi:hypothetical protein